MIFINFLSQKSDVEKQFRSEVNGDDRRPRNCDGHISPYFDLYLLKVAMNAERKDFNTRSSKRFQRATRFFNTLESTFSLNHGHHGSTSLR